MWQRSRLLLCRQTVPVNERCVLSDTLGIKVEATVLQVYSLLEKASLLEVVVEA